MLEQDPLKSSEYSLADMGLPKDYFELHPDDQGHQRMLVFNKWHQSDQPNVVCTDPVAFGQAVCLMVEGYLKPWNRAAYYFRDPRRKYEIVRSLCLPPSVPTEPSKTLIHACRGFTKTVTVIHQAALTMALTRPRTEIAVTEYNDKRTREEVKKVKRQIEDNELIHRDFGGKGILYPKSNKRHTWNDGEIELLNGSKFIGASVGAAQRGRHPDVGIIDDPEKDKKKSRNPDFRREYFEWLFRVYLPMFTWGGLIMWVGTPVDEHSCLQLALRGESETEDGQERDKRFDDWNKVRIRIIEENPETGERESLFPDYISVEAFDQKVSTMGYAAAMAELMGDPVMEGSEVFDRHEYRHGFMKCVDQEDESQQYFLDLKTGKRMPWSEWLESLAVFGANDIGDSTSPDSDPATSVFIGIDPEGIVYVLDVWGRRCLVDEHVPMAFAMAEGLNCQRMGWERAALQSVVCRWTRVLTQELREAGKMPPIHVEVRQDALYDNKVRRIVGALSPLIAKEEIRFLYFTETVTPDGTKHKPARVIRKAHHLEIKKCIDTFTDNGCSGFIDYLDALEMALRVAGHRKGEDAEIEDKPLHEQIDMWRDAGIDIKPGQIPVSKWTRKMLEDAKVGVPDREPDDLFEAMVY